MLLEDSPVGQLVPISGHDPRHGREYHGHAFLPHALPNEVDLAAETWAVVVEASSAVARLDQAGQLIPNPALLWRPLLRREAVSTSALEGTHAAFTEVLEADVNLERPRSKELREVLNYVRAAEHALDAVAQGRSITVGLLEETHRTLVTGTDSDGQESGRIRSTQVLIGPDGCSLENARFVPPPPGERLRAGIDDLLDWMRTPTSLPPLVKVALAHYQFETLHPFHDGNGRIGRLLVLLQFLESNELREPLLEVSPWLEARRRQYQDHLLDVSRTGNWDAWVRFFAEAISVQATQTVRKVDALLGYQTRTREWLRGENVRGVALDIADGLIGQPMISPTWAALTYGVSYPAANTAIARLSQIGVLEEVTGGSYGRVFAAREVVELLEARAL